EGSLSPPLGTFRIDTMNPAAFTIQVQSDLRSPRLAAVERSTGCRDVSTQLSPGVSLAAPMDSLYVNPLTTSLAQFIEHRRVCCATLLETYEKDTLTGRVVGELAVIQMFGVPPEAFLCCTDPWAEAGLGDVTGRQALVRALQVQIWVVHCASLLSGAVGNATSGSVLSGDDVAPACWMALSQRAELLGLLTTRTTTSVRRQHSELVQAWIEAGSRVETDVSWYSRPVSFSNAASSSKSSLPAALVDLADDAAVRELFRDAAASSKAPSTLMSLPPELLEAVGDITAHMNTQLLALLQSEEDFSTSQVSAISYLAQGRVAADVFLAASGELSTAVFRSRHDPRVAVPSPPRPPAPPPSSRKRAGGVPPPINAYTSHGSEGVTLSMTTVICLVAIIGGIVLLGISWATWRIFAVEDTDLEPLSPSTPKRRSGRPSKRASSRRHRPQLQVPHPHGSVDRLAC
ncbi:hypothetical protein CYMTET_11815, partial [Cymbomonas tetramitiformis]